MTSNLVAERRSDKHGNIVTRWVRQSLNKPDAGRAIPNVSLKPVSNITRGEAKSIYERLMAPLPQGSYAVLSCPIGSDESVYLQYDNRNILHGAWRFRAYEIIPLLEMHGENFKYRTIFDAAEMLFLHGHNNLVPSITSEQLSAFETLTNAMKAARYDTEMTTGELSGLPLHVLLHPEDGLILEATVRKGVSDDATAFTILAEVKEGKLSTPIIDGFL